MISFITNTKHFLNLQKYLDKFEENNDLSNLYDNLVLNEYFGNTRTNDYKINEQFEYIIRNLQNSNYWSNPFNCELNMTSEFNERKFNIKKFKCLDKNLHQLFDKLSNIEIQ